MLAPTTALRKISSLKKKIKVIQGGQGASKTFSILLILINHASSKANKEIFIVSAELSKMRITIIKDFVTILKLTGLVNTVSFTSGTLCRFPNGSFIKFLGMDKDDIGKGLRSDVVFINEANKIKFEAYRELTSRAKNVYLDFNPNSEFWAHTDVITRKDADFLKLTYKDNEFLSKEEVYEIERYKELGYKGDKVINDYWANKWRVYGLGEQGIIDGCIFQNWKVGEFDYTLPSIYGMDFGVKDPDTLIEVALNYKTNQLYVKEHIYRSGLSPDELRESVKKVADIDKPMICDSADARMVNMLFDAGFNVFGAKKDKVIEGINALQNYDIILEPNSENLIKEFQNYIWLDRRGEVPSGDYNHCFIGSTLIETNKGSVKIEDIKVGDLVLTSKGYKPIVRKFDNGVKNVNDYLLLFNDSVVKLSCTENHKININDKWVEIKYLKDKDFIYTNVLNNKIVKDKVLRVASFDTYQARVYDLMVDEQHEYFANGVLVHNCIDPLRYCEKYLNFNKN